MCAVVMSCAPGCRVIRYYFPSDEIEIATDDPRVLRSPEPINSVSTRGLEVRLWVVDDTDWAAARSLSLYLGENQSGQIDNPILAADSERWADWGFRLIAVPIDEVEGFLDTLRPVQPISVQWLGEFGQWRAIIRAGTLQSSHVRVGQHSVKIERGRPRLIARSWVEPMLTPTDVVPGVRLDLGLQIETQDSRARRQRDAGFFDAPRERSIEDDGPVFDELIFSAMLDGSHAIIIVGEAPDVDWDSLPDPEPLFVLDSDVETDSRAGGFGPSESPKADGDEPTAGQERIDVQRRSPTARRAVSEPSKPMGKTLGELMLTSPGSRIVRANQTRIVPKRVIVVLIPRVEGGYSLLPRRQVDSSGGTNP